MMSKELMKKTILPMLLLAAWAWIAYYFCVSLGQTEWWKIWMVVVWYVLRAVFILVKYFMSVLK